MILKPTTRDQARSNAIVAAELAHDEGGSPRAKYWANVSQAWAAIAETFPDKGVSGETPPRDVVFLPGDKIYTEDEDSNNLYRFTVLKSGDLVLEGDSRPVPDVADYHDEGTLTKVRDALNRALRPGAAESCITEMQNAGILFREINPLGDVPEGHKGNDVYLIKMALTSSEYRMVHQVRAGDSVVVPKAISNAWPLTNDEADTILALRDGTAVVHPASGRKASVHAAESPAKALKHGVVGTGHPITPGVLQILRAFVGAQVVWSPTDSLKMSRVDFDRYKTTELVLEEEGNTFTIRLAPDQP
jgi:hypothetical protein